MRSRGGEGGGVGVLIANIFICSCCASPQIIASADWNRSGLFVNLLGLQRIQYSYSYCTRALVLYCILVGYRYFE